MNTRTRAHSASASSACSCASSREPPRGLRITVVSAFRQPDPQTTYKPRLRAVVQVPLERRSSALWAAKWRRLVWVSCSDTLGEPRPRRRLEERRRPGGV